MTDPGQRDVHDSGRPGFEDDMLVVVRLRPANLEAMRRGRRTLFTRLDAVAGQHGTYDLYLETMEPPDEHSVDAGDAPTGPDWPHGVAARRSVRVYWIATDLLERGGEKVSGPYLTETQAMGAREVLEKRGSRSYWIRGEDLTFDELARLIAGIDG
jgi:hypothetical protein